MENPLFAQLEAEMQQDHQTRQRAYRELATPLQELYKLQATSGRGDLYAFTIEGSDSLFLKFPVLSNSATYTEVGRAADGDLVVRHYRPAARYLGLIEAELQIIDLDQESVPRADIIPGLDHPEYDPRQWQSQDLHLEGAELQATFVGMAVRSLRSRQ